MRAREITAAVLFASCAIGGALGCSSPGAPSAQPTVSVTNPLCDAAGNCRTLQIRAFVWAFPVPQPPNGLKVVANVEGPTACLPFAAAWELAVTGYDSAGRVTDSTTYTWSPDHPDGIYLAGVDWPASPGDTLYQGTLGLTETFVPADAAGWTLSFTRPGSGGYPYTATLQPSNTCAQP